MQISELYQSNCLAAKTKLLHRNIFIFLSLTFALSSTSAIYVLGIFILFSALILAFTKTNALKLFKLLCIPLVFVLFSCLAIVVNINFGEPLISFNQFYLGYTSASILQAALICCKSIAVSSIFFFYMLSTSISEIATSMRSIKIPCLFIELFILTYKYIFCVINRSNQLFIAQKSRMAYCKRKGTYQSISFWLSSVLIGSINEASIAHNGLQSRAYNNRFNFVSPQTKHSIKLSIVFVSLISIEALALFLTL